MYRPNPLFWCRYVVFGVIVVQFIVSRSRRYHIVRGGFEPESEGSDGGVFSLSPSHHIQVPSRKVSVDKEVNDD